MPAAGRKDRVVGPRRAVETGGMDDRDAARIEKALRFLVAHRLDQPDLAATAAVVGLSPFHLQRLFKRWAGVSPKRFLQYLTAAHARRLLDGSRSVMDVAWATGLSGPGRLHDLTVHVHALSPGELQRAGEGVVVRHGRHPTPLGEVVVATTARGVCGLAFVDEDDRGEALADLATHWPAATLLHDAVGTRGAVEGLLQRDRPARGVLDLQGTNFQLRVWEALLRVPEGALVTYARIAAAIGAPRAARAVGSAVARNPIAWLIPCHRVIRATGVLGAWRWGPVRKQMLIGREAALVERERTGPAAGPGDVTPRGCDARSR